MLNLPDKSPEIWNKFFKENKPLVYRYVIKQIKLAIDADLPEIALFCFGNTDTKAMAYEKNYIMTLEDALKVFVEAEDYEYADQTRKILDAYYINKVIKESNGV